MKKFLPYILILIILVGVFGITTKTNAALQDATGTCYYKPGTLDFSGKDIGGTIVQLSPPAGSTAQQVCGLNAEMEWRATGATTPSAPLTAYQVCIDAGGTYDSCKTLSGAPTAGSTGSTQTEFQQRVTGACSIYSLEGITGCLVGVLYLIFYVVPSFILAAVAYFFNVLISVSLSSDLFKNNFVSQGWTVVRDLSNIFFILILLYIAIKTILGLGGETKKMIVQVILMALLINFSMFMTKVVIDTSNVLALIFYNRLEVKTVVNGTVRDYPSVRGEKDVAGGMVAAFDPTTTLKKDFFDKTREQYVNGRYVGMVDNVPPGTMIFLILVAGAVMLFAAYALFVSGLSFLGRLIELWILIIFSPFAFMSSTISILNDMEYLGWKAWLARLLKVAFMAPIFMFFLYFIFLLIHSNIFSALVQTNPVGEKDAAGVMKNLLGLLLPMMLILVLLIKATEFAKKGSGTIGGAIIKGGTMVAGVVGGLALGVATGGTALAARTVIGGALGGAANKVGAKRVGSYLQSKSYDLRTAPGASKLISAAGLTSGAGLIKTKEGGWTQMKKEQVEKRQKRADQIIERKTSGKKKAVEEAETKLEEAKLPVRLDLENAEQVIEKFRKELSDAQKAGDVGAARAAKSSLDTAKRTKAGIKTKAGLDTFEKELHNAKRALDIETGKVASAEAERVRSKWSKTWGIVSHLGAYSVGGADEAARRIRRRAKLTEEKH